MPNVVEVIDAGPGYTTVLADDGQTYTIDGDRNWRNNNPGNIEYGDFAKSQGAVGTDGRFAVFPNYEAGQAAQEYLQFESPSYRDLTILEAISRYAPSFENNSQHYAQTMANAVGADLDTRMSELSAEQRKLLLAAQQEYEGFNEGSIFANGEPVSVSFSAGAVDDPLPAPDLLTAPSSSAVDAIVAALGAGGLDGSDLAMAYAPEPSDTPTAADFLNSYDGSKDMVTYQGLPTGFTLKPEQLVQAAKDAGMVNGLVPNDWVWGGAFGQPGMAGMIADNLPGDVGSFDPTTNELSINPDLMASISDSFDMLGPLGDFFESSLMGENDLLSQYADIHVPEAETFPLPIPKPATNASSAQVADEPLWQDYADTVGSSYGGDAAQLPFDDAGALASAMLDGAGGIEEYEQPTMYTTEQMEVLNPAYLDYIEAQKADPIGAGPGEFGDMMADLSQPVSAAAPPKYITVDKTVPVMVAPKPHPKPLAIAAQPVTSGFDTFLGNAGVNKPSDMNATDIQNFINDMVY